MSTLRCHIEDIFRRAAWTLPMVDALWSPRMTHCAGLFVIEKDRRDAWQPEIRLSTSLIRRRDRPWPVQVCGCLCRNPEAILRRILEHELIHYKLWRDGDKDWGHTERFRQIAWEVFAHQSITHGIGDERTSCRYNAQDKDSA